MYVLTLPYFEFPVKIGSYERFMSEHRTDFCTLQCFGSRKKFSTEFELFSTKYELFYEIVCPVVM